MQKIFYNAKFVTNNENFEIADAMLVNEGSIVFVGKSDEVLNMKNDKTELIDLNDKFVIPTFFDLNVSLYSMIENCLKNANKGNFIEKTNENDEDYEKFKNFDIYKTEFLNLQNKVLENGVTTVHEHISSKQEFVFWKKISEMGDLKIDVIGYIDFIKNKKIMDDNCRSYRKYKNHFRLGGYYVCLDGSILDKRAWIKKSYPKEKGFSGFGELGYEQLSFILKTVIEEKKQLIVKAYGDRAVEEFLVCYEEYIYKNKIEDNFRPMIFGCNFISKTLLEKISKLNLICNFEIDNLIYNQKVLKSYFGFRFKRIVPLKLLLKNNYNFVLSISADKVFNAKEVIDNFYNSAQRNLLYLKNFVKIKTKKLLDMLILQPAYYSFDSEHKGSFESGKNATFLVVEKDNADIENDFSNINLISVYSNGEKIY